MREDIFLCMVSSRYRRSLTASEFPVVPKYIKASRAQIKTYKLWNYMGSTLPVVRGTGLRATLVGMTARNRLDEHFVLVYTFAFTNTGGG